MVTLTIIRNPFEPWNGREQKTIDSGLVAKELAEQYKTAGTEMLVVVNGNEVDDNYVLQDGDFVVVSAVVAKGGKNIFGMILAIGLSVFAGAIVGANALAGIGITSGTFGAYMVATAVMFLGNFLVGRMMGQDVDTGSYGKENPTYSWAGVQTMTGQNNAVALTYGTVVSGGQTIGKYVQTIDNDEYLNWLVACGEGTLEITDIKINENDVSYFDGVDVEVRNGTNTQTVIPNFNDTYFTKPLQYVLDENERIDTAQGNGTEGLIVKVEFQKGLWHSTNEGKITTAWVRLLGYYRQGLTGEWIPFVYEKTTENEYIKSISSNAPTGTYRLYVADSTVGTGDDAHTVTTARITYPDTSSVSATISRGVQFTLGYFTVLIPNDEETPSTINETFAVAFIGAKISGNQTSPLRKEYRIDNLSPAEYYVKLLITARSNSTTDTRSAVECTWSAITSIIYDDFCYPNTALIGIKALATNQLNGNPTLKFTKTRSTIYAWNPHTAQYEEKPANNPAWASYDILHLCRYLEDSNNLGHFEYVVFGVSADRMLYDQFEEWAEFCSDKEFYVNIEINQLGEMLDVINQKVAPIGHGRVLRFGTRYGCNWDCAKMPVQMFGMGNIKAGTFQEQFLPTNDRANAVELTYTDADNGFERETITIMADDYDTATEIKTAQATFDGITNYEQAYKEGKYQLYCNRYRIRTVTFEADIDAISCTIGDVVLVAHDVPKWGKSGRVYAVDGDVLTLPVELSDSTLNYRILYRTVNDNMHTANCEILENADGWCKVKIASFDVNDPPQANDVFDIAVQSIGTKPFIIQNISRAKDFSRRIDCIEYDERIYNEDYDIPEIEYTEVDLRPKNVTNLVARIYSITIGYHVDVSWQQASAGSFTVYFNDGTNWHMVASGLKVSRFSADTEYSATQVRVVTTNGVIASSGTVADVQNIDGIISALYINNLSASVVMGENVSDITATWDDVLATNLKNYVVGFRGNNDNTLNATALYEDVPFGTYDLTVKAKTIEGTYGSESKITIDNGTTGYTKTVPGNMTTAKPQTICGRTIVWNQQSVDDSTLPTGTVSGITVTLDNHVFTFRGTTTSALTINFRPSASFYANHVYIVALKTTNVSGKGGNIRVYDNTHSTNIINTSTGTGYRMFTATQDFTGRYYINCGTGIQLDCTITPQFFDLTEMFGAGNEPTTVEEFQHMFPASYYPHDAGTLLSAKTTSVVSKNGGITVETYNIPASVQSITGYGWSCPTAQNYVDFSNKKFVQNVGSRSYVAGDEYDSNVITDKTNTYYKLNSAVKTNVTITDEMIDVVGSGSITFANQNGSDFCIPISSTMVYA